MPKKKSESLIEQTEEIVEKAAKKVKKEAIEVGEKIGKEIVKLADEFEDAFEGKSTKKKVDGDKAEKLAKLKEKAKKLGEAIKEDTSDLKKKIKPEEGKETLAPIEDYLKSSIHLGTRAITPDMKSFVYKRRADSLAVFNTAILDEKIIEAGNYLAKYSPEEIVVVCKRDAGAKAVELFSSTTGIHAFIKNYPAGILTNPNLVNFMEKELVFICDPWTDKSALDDALRIKIPVLAICDTNNYTAGIDKIIPGNNKSPKSLGFILYLLAKLYVEKRKLKNSVPDVSKWVENWENLIPPK